LVVLWSEDRQYEHGPLLVVVMLALLFRDRSVLLSAARAGIARILPLILASIAWWVAYSWHVVSAQQCAAVLVGLAMFWAVGGEAGLTRALVPIGLLVLGSEIWEHAAPLLRAMAVMVARVLVSAIGIPVHVDGTMIEVPAGRFEVQGGCSGIKFALVAAALAVFYGHVQKLGLANRLKVLAALVFVALCANWIRIAAIIIIGEYTQLQSSIVRDHYWFSWTLFAVALIPMLAILRRYDAAEQDSPDAVASVPVTLRWLDLAIVVGALSVGPVLSALRHIP
jgi:exosortase